MADLIAIRTSGPDFVAALESAWNDGDAVAPIDPHTPPTVVEELLGILRPAAVVDEGRERHRLAGGVPVEDGDALVVTTSGTTGTPRGVVLTHDAVEASAYATTTRLGVDPDTCWLACLPLNHIGGLSVVTRALTTGTALKVLPGFDVEGAMQAAAEGATHVSLVPTALRRLPDPSVFRVILLGGSAIPSDRPPNTIATYGMTETGSGVVYEGLALNGVCLRIAEDGEICVRGQMLLRCYRNADRELDPFDAHGWFRTGDVGSINRTTGLLSVEGRKDEMIITGGEKVWPLRVEEVLRRDPRVGDVAVVGRPDPEWGQRVVAVVVPSDPSAPPRLEELRWLAKERLPAWAAPKSIELVESLPKTALGKIRRREL